MRLRDEECRRGLAVSVEARTSSSSCSCSSPVDERSESSDRRAMIVSRVEAAIGKAVRMDERVRDEWDDDPELDADVEPERLLAIVAVCEY